MIPSIPWAHNAPPPVGHAPGVPGMAPSWTSSDKDLVGTAIGSSRLWFTIGHGIVNEVYCPRIDIPQIRDLGFIVADDAGFWVEVKRSTDYTLAVPAPGATIAHGRGRIWATGCYGQSRGRSERRCWRAGRTVKMRSALRRRATSACPTAGRISLPTGAWPGITPKRGRATWR